MAGQQGAQAQAAKFDMATLGGILAKLDASFSSEKLAGLIKGAGVDESHAVQNVFRQLGKIFLGQESSVSEAELPALLKNLDAAISGGATGSLVMLSGVASDKLISMANDDIGVRYALMSGLPFAIAGNAALYDNLNRDGSLYRFDPNTGERTYTDEWLKDRSQFMSLKASANGDGNIAVSGTQSWIFEERNADGATRIDAIASEAQRAPNKMIFATATNETQTIVGGAGGDHVYSGAGDDLINSGAGDDYVEGGAGDDMVDGGRGNDQLLGGRGNDQIDGGLGDDKIFGGSGADYLVGGQGNDRLDGGDGFDTYVIDGNDGNDVIIDADGKGEVIYDGVVLTGAEHPRDGKYSPAVGSVRYSFAGDPEEGGVLTISTQGGSVKIVNFKNGNLGISLGDGSPSGLLTGSLEPDPASGDSRSDSTVWSANSINNRASTDLNLSGPSNTKYGVSNSQAPRFVASETSAAPKPSQSAGSESGMVTATTAVDSGNLGALFAGPAASIPLLTGEDVSQAISVHYPMDSRAIAHTNVDGMPVAARFATIPDGVTENDGISLRHLEYALMDFHDAININAGLGGSNLGDAASIGVGTSFPGSSFDKSPLSDDRYTDLGSKKIGVKG